MKEKNSYEVFARVDNKVGTVTVRDLLSVKKITGTKIESLLNLVPKISVDAELFQAAKIMSEYRLRALPIFAKNKIIGKIDIKTIVNNVKDSALGKIRASKIMTPTPTTISAKEKVSKAREIMLREKIVHLPIVENKKLVGIITSTKIVFDFLASVESERYIMGVSNVISPLNRPVETAMSTQLLTCDPQTPIGKVAENMLNQNSSYCLVTVGDEVQGIITYRDYANLVSPRNTKPEAPVYMIGLPTDPFEAEAAKVKFIRLVNGLSRFLPPILEAKSIIKSSSKGPKKRYEVTVSIKTAKTSYNYSSGGWDLPAIYDEISKAVKKMATLEKEIRKKRRNTSRRKA